MNTTTLKENIKGIFVILATPFQENYELDLIGLRQNIDYCVKSGIHGIVIGGTVGEFFALTREERFTLIKEATEAVENRVPVIACTAHSSIKEAIQLNH